MRSYVPLSDQLITWSDILAATIFGCAAQASRGAAAAATSAARRAARLPHRTLQTLRQARLQVHGRPRARPEVLPVSELSEAATGDGLRPAGVGGSDSHKPQSLSAGPGDPRADLRDQPRTTAAPRGDLRCAGERHSDAHRLGRPSVCEHPARQYAPRLDRRRAPRCSCFGQRLAADCQPGGGR